ncbi:MAG: YceI family protein [Planctomycetota bacterium]|nr:MAG: YceI family protein [Planctomycetota bacterium]
MARYRTLLRITAAGCLAGMLALAASTAAAAPFAVDAVHSTVLFSIKHLNTSTAWGRFNEMSGTVELEGDNSQIDVQLQVDSVDTADAKRDQHLKGPDFFSAKQFPTISFKSTKITKVDENSYEVEGKLTLHGVSKPIQVTIQTAGPNRGLRGMILGLDTEFKIKRSDYGMKFMLGGLSDEVRIIVSLECSAQ